MLFSLARPLACCARAHDGTAMKEGSPNATVGGARRRLTTGRWSSRQRWQLSLG